jgi:hypothetical protein
MRSQRSPRLLFGGVAAGLLLAATVFSQPSLGRISFPNSGTAQAQALFVRGILLLHSFEYDDAIEAFRQAQRADPGFAMAYWGEAVASDESSFAASVDRVKRQGLSMAQADFHSLGWLHYEYLQQGRFAKAREVMQTWSAPCSWGPALAGPRPPPVRLKADPTRGMASRARSAADSDRCR